MKPLAYRNFGFTLLEVLVAAVILFSSVMAITLVYRSSLISADKATVKVQQTAVVPSIIEKIKVELNDKSSFNQGDKIEGLGQQLGVNYRYVAEVIEVSAPADKFDYTTGKIESFPKKFVLLKVTLTLGAKAPLDYIYHEVAWL
ncbi:PulJ/GspJ family protein [Pseudoalteromonas xiamenensis]